METHLLLDMSSIMYKYFHGTIRVTASGNLLLEDNARIAEVMNFKFFSECLRLQELFCSRYLWFLFDHRSARLEQYPGYKKKRAKQKEDWSPAQKELHKIFQRNMADLRTNILHDSLGFRNIHRKDGYEADDFIAAITWWRIPRKHQIMIVSGDSDLYQLINKRCSVYNVRTNEVVTRKIFMKKYGIEPRDWSFVKSIMGDDSDCIKGVKGIGLKRALAYVKGELDEESRHFINIESHKKRIERNMKLIKLPYRELNYDFIGINKDKTSLKRWQRYCINNPLCRKLQNQFLRGNNDV